MRLRLLIGITLFAVVVGIGFTAYQAHRVFADVPSPSSLSSDHDESSQWRFHKQLTSEEKQHILDGEFVIVTKTEAMPSVVKQAFTVITGQQSFALANPGQKYQVTDVFYEPGLPLRRLLFAGVKDNEWFIHYEHGGRGHGYSVVVFKIDPHNRLHFLWGGAGFEGAKQFEELRTMVATGRFSDDAAFYW